MTTEEEKDKSNKLLTNILLAVAGALGMSFLGLIGYLDTSVYESVKRLENMSIIVNQQILSLQKTDEFIERRLDKTNDRVEENSKKISTIREALLIKRIIGE